MKELRRRVLLGAVALLWLLTGIFAPAEISVDNARVLASPLSEPDLVIESITWIPETPKIGNLVTFTVTIKNKGDVTAGSSHITSYIDDTLLHTTPVDPIAPDKTTTRTISWKAQPGHHNIKVIADINNSVTESDETNNDKTYALSVLAPDLTVEAITWSPENPSIADEVTFTIAIKNQGNCQAGSSNVNLFINGSPKGYKSLPWIDAGDNITMTYTWVAQAGSHHLDASADFLDQVRESDETNNEKSLVYQTATPDLIVDTITWSPENPSEYAQLTFTMTIKNQGTGKAPDSLLLYYINDEPQAAATVAPINAGGTITKTFYCFYETGLNTVKAVIDANNEIIESDETNNELVSPLPSIAPDLTIVDITWSPETPLIAHRVTFSVKIKNQGKTAVGQTILYFCIDEIYDSYQEILPIAAGGTVQKNIPWTSQVASSEVTAHIDIENVIAESNESNNKRTETVTFSNPTPTADLIVTDIVSSPENPEINDKVTFTVSIKNQGTKASGASHIDYYIDNVLMDSAFVNNIDAGDTVTNKLTWKAEAGSHIIKTVADSNDSVFETNETNNEKIKTISVVAPDLVVSGATWSPLTPSIGDEVTFTVSIKNQGNKRSNGSRVAYYIDSSTAGEHYIEPINIGATVNKTFTWTVQARLHSIMVVADIGNSIAESDESNNAQTITIPAPDLIIDEITWSPANPTENTTVIFTVTTKNQGGSKADLSHLAYYIGDSGQTPVHINQIITGDTSKRTFTWKAQAGTYVLKAVADEGNNVIESDESNNVRKAILTVPLLPEDTPLLEPAENVTAAPTDEPQQEAGAAEEGSAPPPVKANTPKITENPPSESSPFLQAVLANWWIIIAVAMIGPIVILLRSRLRKKQAGT